MWGKHYFRCLLELRLDQLKGGGSGGNAEEALAISGEYANYRSKNWRENQRNRRRAISKSLALDAVDAGSVVAEDNRSHRGTAAVPAVGSSNSSIDGDGNGAEMDATTRCLSGADSQFVEFAAAELALLGIDAVKDSGERRKLAAIEEADDHEHALRCIHALRGALTPLLERFIALDRASFLQEHALGDAATVALIPVFDPEISPRCTAIVGLVN